MRLLSSSRAVTLVAVAAALAAGVGVAAASGSRSDPGPPVVATATEPPRADVDPDGGRYVANCCPLSGTLPAVGWYARSFRARSWREFLLPFAGRGESECPAP